MYGKQLEYHPLGFFLPPHAKILMLGSFPPPRKRWVIDFYYPNYQNDMWKIMGMLFYHDKNYFLDIPHKTYDLSLILDFLNTKGIALGDTAESVIRLKNNASDTHLKVVKPINLKVVLEKIPKCHTLVTTGQKASDILAPILNVKDPKVGAFVDCIFQNRSLRWYRMPSSSRAYPRPLEEKTAQYIKAFGNLL